MKNSTDTLSDDPLLTRASDDANKTTAASDPKDAVTTSITEKPRPKTTVEKLQGITKNFINSKVTGFKHLVFNYGFKMVVGITCWCLGYMEWSVLWVVIGTCSALYSMEQFKRKKKITQMYRRATEDQARLVDAVKELHHETASCLPSWIFFPDVEKVEWMNRIIRQLWPSIQGFTKGVLTEKVEPSIRQSNRALNNFRFTDMDLGSIPPQVVGVKVYSEHQTRTDEIVMDMQVVFASNCNLGVNIGASYLSAGLCDLHFRGLMRVEMQPLLPRAPFFGALAVSFVHDPIIDFNLTNMANLFDIPGLDSLLRSAVSESVRGLIVYPEKYIIKMVPDIDLSYLKFPLPEGILRVHILQAKNLIAMDTNIMKKNSSDPYVIVTVGRCFKYKTSVIKGNLNPVWNESFDVVVDDVWHQTMNIALFDEDRINKDDSLGTATLPVRSIFERGQVEEWIELSAVKQGKIKIRFEWHNLSDNPNDLDEAVHAAGDQPDCAGAYLSMYIDEARYLPVKSKECLTSNAQMKIHVPGRSNPFKSQLADFNSPCWQERFFTPIKNPRFGGQVTFEIKSKTGGNARQSITRAISKKYIECDFTSIKTLGTVRYTVGKLLTEEGMCVDKEFQMDNSGPKSILKMRLCLRTLKMKDKQGPAFDVNEVNNGKPSSVSDSERGPRASSPGGGETVDLSKKENEEEDVPKETSSSADGNHSNNVISLSPSNPHLSHLMRSSSITSVASVMSLGAVQRARNNKRPSVAAGDVGGGSVEIKPDYGKGRIQLVIRFLENYLYVVVVKAENLTICDHSNETTDPYVKVSLIGTSLSKKTKVIKNSLNPKFDEKFAFHLPRGTTVTEHTLKVSVKNHTGLLSQEKVYIGALGINLSTVPNITDPSKPHTCWYPLE